MAIRSENKAVTPSRSGGESGQTLVEYAMILGFVAVALVASLLFLEKGISLKYDEIIAVVQELV